MELPKRIDRFVVRAAFGVQDSFTAAVKNFPKGWPGLPQQLEQRSNEAPSATIAKLRSATNWVLSATSMHRMVAITVKKEDYSFQISQFSKISNRLLPTHPDTNVIRTENNTLYLRTAPN